MALLGYIGFDWSGTLLHYANILNWTISTSASLGSPGRSGSGNYLSSATSDWFRGATFRFAAATQEMVIGFAYYNAGIPNADICRIFDGVVTDDQTGNLQVALATDATGNWRIKRNSTVLATSSGAIFPVATWIYVELKVKIDNSTGTYELKINGVTRLTASSQDTQHTANATAGSVGFRNGSYDDIYVLNTTGAPSDYLGDITARVLRPSAAGNAADFTPSAGANYQNVDEATPNDDTDYNASLTPGDIDTFALTDSPIGVGTVYGVQQYTRARKDDAGGRVMRAVLRTGGADFEDADFAATDTYSTELSPIRAVNPDTTVAWTISELNSLEAGYKLES